MENLTSNLHRGFQVLQNLIHSFSPRGKVVELKQSNAPCTDFKSVYLPAKLIENLANKEARTEAMGLVIHECAHLWYTRANPKAEEKLLDFFVERLAFALDHIRQQKLIGANEFAINPIYKDFDGKAFLKEKRNRFIAYLKRQIHLSFNAIEDGVIEAKYLAENKAVNAKFFLGYLLNQYTPEQIQKWIEKLPLFGLIAFLLMMKIYKRNDYPCQMSYFPLFNLIRERIKFILTIQGFYYGQLNSLIEKLKSYYESRLRNCLFSAHAFARVDAYSWLEEIPYKRYCTEFDAMLVSYIADFIANDCSDDNQKQQKQQTDNSQGSQGDSKSQSSSNNDVSNNSDSKSQSSSNNGESGKQSQESSSNDVSNNSDSKSQSSSKNGESGKQSQEASSSNGESDKQSQESSTSSDLNGKDNSDSSVSFNDKRLADLEKESGKDLKDELSQILNTQNLGGSENGSGKFSELEKLILSGNAGGMVNLVETDVSLNKDEWEKRLALRAGLINQLSLSLKKQLMAYFKHKPNSVSRNGRRVSEKLISKVAQNVHVNAPFIAKSKGESMRTHIVLLVDSSGSMGRPDKQDSLQDALLMLAESLGRIENTNLRFSILQFGSDVNYIKKPNEKLTLDLLSKVFVSGSTPGYEAYCFAGKELLESKMERKIIICLTDGAFDSVNRSFSWGEGGDNTYRDMLLNQKRYQFMKGIENYGIMINHSQFQGTPEFNAEFYVDNPVQLPYVIHDLFIKILSKSRQENKTRAA